MIKRICPICDQEMKSAHYCRNCRSWVKQPYVREANYYLNERHPKTETACSYHMPEMTGRDITGYENQKPSEQCQERTGQQRGAVVPAGSGGQKMKRFVPVENGWQTRQQRVSVPTGEGRQPKQLSAVRPSADQAPKKGSVVPIVLFAAAGALILIGLVTMVQGVAGSSAFSEEPFVYDSLEPTWADDWAGEYEEYPYDEYAYDGEYAELDDEVVIAMGQACNGSDHFEVEGRAMVSQVKELLKSIGLTTGSEETYSYNEVSGDGSSWYHTWTLIPLSSYGQSIHAEDSYECVELDYDTATGMLHGVDIVIDHPEAASAVTGMVLALIDQADVSNGEAAWTAEVTEAMKQGVEQDEYFEWYGRGMQVYASYYDGSYAISVWPAEDNLL